MKKRLPVGEPFIDSYKMHGIPMAIMANEDRSMGWILNNYLQLFIPHDFTKDNHWLNFYVIDPQLYYHPNNPWITIHQIDKNLISKMVDINQFIINSIERNYYVRIDCDQFYLPNTLKYNRVHHKSGILIRGYNQELCIFDSFDYSYNTKRLFEDIKFDFDVIKESTMSKICVEDPIMLIKLKKNPQFEFNMNLVNQLLEDYLYSRNTYML